MTAQDRTARTYLATLPEPKTFRERLTALFDQKRLTVPRGPDRVLIDPNGWSQDGATALAEWSPSEDGKHLAFAVQDGGKDWRTIRVLDVATAGRPVEARVHHTRRAALNWNIAGVVARRPGAQPSRTPF